MKPFDELRKLASDRRDHAIESAKSEYRKTLHDIAAMERRLGIATQRQTLSEAILSIVPNGREFFLDDVCRWLAANDPGRTFTRGSVGANIRSLVKQGSIKRVRNPQRTKHAAYAVLSLDCDRQERTILDMAEAILRKSGQPMTATEIMVTMIEAGFDPAIEPKRASQSLRRGMSKRTSRFKRNGQKWLII